VATALGARLKRGESLGDRIVKVDHAGEHGAVCIYSAQIAVSRWRSPRLVPELQQFLAHEQRHRRIFTEELARRGRSRCRSYHLCGLGGLILGLLTGLAGPQAIHATTAAIERVVLLHMTAQLAELAGIDGQAHAALKVIIEDEQSHHDQAEAQKSAGNLWVRLIDPVVRVSTEVVIWLGMKL
jgi:3-demethoxyubiquinol 3-hydroxylase